MKAPVFNKGAVRGRLTRLVRICFSWLWSMVPYRYEWRLFVWLAERVPIRTVKTGQWAALRVKLDLDMGPEEWCVHTITLPVDLREYPDVLEARALSVRLEMVGHADTYPAMRRVWMHAGQGRSYDEDRNSDSLPLSPRSHRQIDNTKSQTLRSPVRESQDK